MVRVATFRVVKGESRDEKDETRSGDALKIASRLFKKAKGNLLPV